MINKNQNNSARPSKITSNMLCKVVKAELGFIVGSKFIHWINRTAWNWGTMQLVKYMKNMLNYAQHFIAGDMSSPELHDLARAYRIRVKPDTLAPYGFFGSIFDMAIHSDRKVGRMLSILKCYQSFDIEPSQGDYEELANSITDAGNLTDTQLRDNLGEIISIFAQSSFSRVVYDALKPLEKDLAGIYHDPIIHTDIGSITPYRARYAGINQRKEKYKEIDWDAVCDNINSTALSLLLAKPSVPDLLQGHITIDDRYMSSLDIQRLRTSSMEWNRIFPTEASSELVVIPKGGAAGRVIAKLNIWDQMIMQKVHNKLAATETESYGFYHMNQQGGAYQVLEWCKLNERDVTAIDLSNATDRIPRLLFTEWCRKVGLPNIGELVEMISSQPFWYQYTKKAIKYSRGQPMGMYGSFPILQFCNYVMLYYSLIKSNTNIPVDKIHKSRVGKGWWAIVGDDVAIRFPQIASQYSQTIVKVDAVENKMKRFSKNLVQFAGFDIIRMQKRDGLGNLKDGDDPIYRLVRPFKFQPNRSVRDKRSLLSLWLMFPLETYHWRWVDNSSRIRSFGSRSDYAPDGTPLYQIVSDIILAPDGRTRYIGEMPSSTTSYGKRVNRLLQQAMLVNNKLSLMAGAPTTRVDDLSTGDTVGAESTQVYSTQALGAHKKTSKSKSTIQRMDDEEMSFDEFYQNLLDRVDNDPDESTEIINKEGYIPLDDYIMPMDTIKRKTRK